MKIFGRNIFLVFMLIVILIFNSNAQQSVFIDYSKIEKGPEILNIYYDLVPLVNVVIVIKTGLKDESPEINGVSHMLEHMLFNGTTKRTQEELYSEIDKNGFYINAQTGEDYIAFTGISEADKIEQLIELMSDMIFHSTFPKEKFKKEKGIILAELERSENSPGYKKEQEKKRWIYGEKSIYAFPVLGSRASIKKIRRDQLIRFYKKHFYSENMLVVTYGKINLNTTKKMVQKFFPKTGTKKKQSISERASENTQIRPDFRIIRDNEYSRLQMKIPGPPPSDYLFPFLFVLNETLFNHSATIMNLVPDSLKKNLVSLAISLEYHKNHSYLLLDAMRTDSLGALLPEKEKYKSLFDSILISLNQYFTPEMMAEWGKEYENNEILHYDKPMYFAFLKAKILSVTGGKHYLKLLDFIKTYRTQFGENYNLFIQQVLKTGSYHPNNLFYSYKSKTKAKKQMEKNAVKIKKVRIFSEPDFPTIIALQNSAIPLSAVHILFKNRFELEKKYPGAVEFIHWLFGKKSRLYEQSQIDSLLSQYSIDVKWHDLYFIPYDDYYFTSEWGYVRSISLAGNFEKQMELLAELIQNIELDKQIFDRTKKELLHEIRKKEKNSIYKIRYGFYYKLSNGLSPKGYPPYGNSRAVSSYNMAQIKSLLSEYVANQNMIISIITPFDPRKVMETVREAFIYSNPVNTVKSNSWEPVEPFVDSLPDPQKSTNHNFYIGFPIKIDEKNTDPVQLQVLNDLLMKKIQFEVREKKGWAYSIGSGIEQVGAATFFICRGAVRKGTLDSTLTIIKNIIEQSKHTGIAEEEKVTVRNSLLAGSLRRYSSAENITYFWGLKYYQNKIKPETVTYNYLERYIEKYKQPINSEILERILKRIDTNSVYMMYSY
jgi:predicted Zn-dependent peptidase